MCSSPWRITVIVVPSACFTNTGIDCAFAAQVVIVVHAMKQISRMILFIFFMLWLFYYILKLMQFVSVIEILSFLLCAFTIFYCMVWTMMVTGKASEAFSIVYPFRFKA